MKNLTPRQIALLNFAKNGLRPGQPTEKEELEDLLKDGYLTREDHSPLTPGGPTPIPTYRTTALGLAVLEHALEN